MNNLAVQEATYLEVYKEEKDLFLPVDLVDGFGKVHKLEDWLRTKEVVEWKTNHYFSDGVYTRETFVPAGAIITGYRHKQKTVSLLTKGIISVIGVDELGYAKDYGTLEAPLTFVTEPKIKKVGLTHEDTIFLNAFCITAIPEEYHNIEHIDMIEEFIFYKDEV